MTPRPSLAALAAILACASACTPCSGLDVEILDHGTEQPARVELFYKVTRCTWDGPEPATGLSLEDGDFKVFEDGAELSDFESQPQIVDADQAFLVDVVLLLDMSGSIIAAEAADSLIDASEAFATSLMPGKTISVATFDGRPELQWAIEFEDELDPVLDALDRLRDYEPVDTSTNLNGAIMDGLTALDQSAAQEEHYAGLLAVFTDGTHRAGAGVGYPGEQAVRRKVASTKHSIFTIGLGGEIDEASLTELGRDGFEWATDEESLTEAFQATAERIAKIASSYYRLSYCSPSRAGRHKLTVEVHYDGETAEASYTFGAGGFGGGCQPD